MHYLSINEQQVTKVSAFDRGLAYGDGFFTTAKISQGVVLLIDAHVARLKHASEVLGISPIDFDRLTAYLSNLAKNYDSGVLKVLVTAGVGGRGYGRSQESTPTIIVSIHDIPAHYQSWQKEGIKAGLANMRLGLNPALSGLKHLNRLEQVLIRAELDRSEYDELIVANISGEVIEATSANLFLQIDNQWFTADVSQSGVNGIVRQFLLSQDNAIKVANTTIEQLKQADAMFITNAILGLVPIREYLGRTLNIASQRYVKLLEQVNC
ncbi:aminodeoxychorismate lyase [Thalassotalea ganghwensis]